MFFSKFANHTDHTREEWSPCGRRAGDEEMEREERGGGDSDLHLGKNLRTGKGGARWDGMGIYVLGLWESSYHIPPYFIPPYLTPLSSILKPPPPETLMPSSHQ